MEKEVGEARKLRQYVTNAEVLREKLRAAELRAERAEANTDRTAASQPSSTDLQHEVAKWNSFYQVGT